VVQATECRPLPVVHQWYVVIGGCYCKQIVADKYPDKTIKLWKVFDKQIKVVAENNHSDGVGKGGNQPLRLPRMTTHDSITAAVPRKVYANAHAYHINSISVNSDGETYISADDLRINLWNLNISDQSFSA
jgi:serine/threonine-protein phosphatase 2A regulatory subunit B